MTITDLMVQLARRTDMAKAMGCRPETVRLFQAAAGATCDVELKILNARRARQGGAS